MKAFLVGEMSFMACFPLPTGGVLWKWSDRSRRSAAGAVIQTLPASARRDLAPRGDSPRPVDARSGELAAEACVCFGVRCGPSVVDCEWRVLADCRRREPWAWTCPHRQHPSRSAHLGCPGDWPAADRHFDVKMPRIAGLPTADPGTGNLLADPPDNAAAAGPWVSVPDPL